MLLGPLYLGATRGTRGPHRSYRIVLVMFRGVAGKVRPETIPGTQRMGTVCDSREPVHPKKRSGSLVPRFSDSIWDG
jgi:hypothetical protein